MGRSSHGHYGTRGCLRRCAPILASRLAGRLACGGFCRGSDRSACRCHESAPRKFSSFLWSGPQISVQLCSADHRWRLVDVCLIRSGSCSRTSRRLAASLRNCYRHRRSIFRARCSGHGLLPHEYWRRRAICAGALGRCIYGSGVRCFADWFRYLDCPAPRGIKGNCMAKSSTAHQERLQRTRERDASLAAVRGSAREAVSPDLDRLIHERIRLGIVSALAVNRSLTFNELKALLKTTDGNLSVHARKLEEADYIICSKSFDGRLPKTEYRLAAAGKRALERYLNHMEALIRATREG